MADDNVRILLCNKSGRFHHKFISIVLCIASLKNIGWGRPFIQFKQRKWKENNDTIGEINQGILLTLHEKRSALPLRYNLSYLLYDLLQMLNQKKICEFNAIYWFKSCFFSVLTTEWESLVITKYSVANKFPAFPPQHKNKILILRWRLIWLISVIIGMELFLSLYMQCRVFNMRFHHLLLS